MARTLAAESGAGGAGPGSVAAAAVAPAADASRTATAEPGRGASATNFVHKEDRQTRRGRGPARGWKRAAPAAGAGGATAAGPGGTAGPAGAELGAEPGTEDVEVGSAAAAAVAPAAYAGRAATAESSKAAVTTKIVNAGDRQAPRACLGAKPPSTPRPSESASRLEGGAAAEAKAPPMSMLPAYAERTAPKPPVPTSLEVGTPEEATSS